MRTATAAELARLNADHTNLHLRVEVQDADGTYQDLTTIGGVDWVESAGWSETIDRQVQTGTIELRREADWSDWTDTDRILDDGSFLITDASDSRVWTDSMAGPYSIAPFIQASPLNKDSLGAYAPLLELGRLGRIKTALVDHGATPGEIDFKEMIQFRVDEIDWRANPVQMQFSDIGALYMDAIIETSKIYGDDLGEPVEDVMNDIGGDVTGVSFGVTVPVSPGWNIFKYRQDRKPLLVAFQDLAMQIGWDVRYRYNIVVLSGVASEEFQLTFYEPDRAKTDPDAVIGPTTYRSVEGLKRSIADIRNVVKVVYGESASVTQSNATSIAKYGRRFMEIANAPNIDAGSEATDMALAAVNDLSEPLADQEIELLYWWLAQLGDLYQFTANGDHYDEDQTLAVVGIQHTIRQGEGVTRIQTRGSVSGAYRNWLRVGGEGTGSGTSAGSDTFGDLTQTPNDGLDQVEMSWTWNGDPSATVDIYIEENPINSTPGVYSFVTTQSAIGAAYVYSTTADLDAGGGSQCNVGFYLRAKVGATYVAESEHLEVVYNRN